MNKIYEYKTTLLKNPEMDAGYIIFPYDIRKEFGRGRVKVHALFDDVMYDGSIVNMGLPDYIIGVNKDIRTKLNKTYGDEIQVKIWERKD